MSRSNEATIGSKLGFDATRKLPGDGFKRAWPPLVNMAENVRKIIDSLFGGTR
jgi:4-hydroxy-3-polyprenylbenzoate decarboxylase